MAAKNIAEVKSTTEQKCKNSDYGNIFLDTLNKMRINKKRCDFSLDVEGEIIQVHTLALQIASPYFAAMFESNMKEAREGVVRLVDTDLIAVNVLVEYMYTGIITLTEDNVETVLFTSDLFRIEWVKKQCEEFLKGCIDFKKCFRIWNIADTTSCKALYDFAYKYILNNFDNVFDNEELLMLPYEKIQELISDDQLSVKCEDNVYKAAINWLKHDVEERKVHLPELLNHIRLPLISTQFLRSHVAAEPLLTQDLKCYKLLSDALFEKLMPVEEGKCSSDRSQIRKGIEYNKEIFHVFLVGGIMHNKSKVYDISKNKLIQISNMNEIRSQHSAIGLNGVVYSMGGYNDSRLRTAECYDPVNKRWNYIAPMSNSRYNFGICSYNDFVYVVGGYDTSTVECYNPASNEWRSCPNIPNGSSYYTRATLVENSIYSLDNYNSASCLRFDPREQRWYEMNMKTNTSYGFELVSYGRTLFCINTDSCKRLDVRMNTWESMPSMHIKRKYFSAVIAADNIYVLGGDGVKRVERYNVSNNEWTTIDWIETEHYRGAAAVVDGDFKF